MYIASLANVSYVYFETDMDNDGVWLDLEFNVSKRDSTKSKLLSPSHEFINGAFIDASHDQWREMISIGQGLIIQNLKYERGYVISFKTLYDMISRCTGENESPLTSLLSSIQHFQHDIESHNAVIDFHILSIEKSIEQLKSLKALL